MENRKESTHDRWRTDRILHLGPEAEDEPCGTGAWHQHLHIEEQAHRKNGFQGQRGGHPLLAAGADAASAGPLLFLRRPEVSADDKGTAGKDQARPAALRHPPVGSLPGQRRLAVGH